MVHFSSSRGCRRMQFLFLWKKKFPSVPWKCMEINNKSKYREITSKTFERELNKKICEIRWKFSDIGI